MIDEISALLPGFISEKINEKRKKGSFRGSALFVDITGFTSKTENLFKRGDTGAETISKILFAAFDEPVRIVYENNGFVSGFAGDAFLALFPEDSGKNLSKAVNSMPVTFRKGVAKGLSLKFGKSTGDIKWGITGNSERSCYYFAGEAVKKAFKTENRKKTRSTEVMRKTIINETTVAPQNILGRFIPHSVFSACRRAEIRLIVPVFVNFGNDDSYGFVDKVTRTCTDLSVKYYGLFNKVEYSDKGLTALVIFGAPKARENADLLSLRFAADVVSKIHGAKAGLDYGLSYAGLTGCLFRNEWTVIGDVVNTSARLMARAEPGEIIVSETLARCSSDIASYDLYNTERLKGKKKKQDLFVLKGLKFVSNPRYQTPFSGRKIEMAKLSQSVLSIFSKNEKKPVLIIGDVGIGKTRLVDEFIKKLDDRYAVNHLRCDGTIKIPWNPFKPWILEQMNIKDESRKSAYMKIQKSLSGPLEHLRPYASFIASMCGYKILKSAYEQSEEKDRVENQIYCLIDLIKANSRGRKIILVVDDFQFVDELSRKFFLRLLKHQTDFNAAVIIVSRECKLVTDFVKGLDYQRIDLKPMSVKCIETIIGHYGFTEQLKMGKELLIKSQGNPFFAEQLAITLKESFGEEHSVNSKVMLPTTLYGVLTSRIDTLEETTRNTVKTASILGYSFMKDILSDILATKKTELEKSIIEAVEKNVFIEKGAKTLSFSHNLLQEAAYQLLMPSERQELHKKALSAMEQGKIGETEAAMIYEQAKKSGVTGKWLYWADLHVKNLMEKYALEDAEKICFEMAESHRKKGNDLQYAEVMLKIGQILETKGEKKNALKTLKDSLLSAKKSGSESIEAKITVNIAGVQVAMGDILEAETTLKEAANLISKTNDPLTTLDAINMMGLIYRNHGNYREAIEKYKQALETASDNALAFGQIKVLMNMAAVYNMLSEYENSEKCLKRCIGLKEFRENRRLMAGVYNNLGINYLKRSFVRKSLSYFIKSYEIKKKIGDMSGQASSLHNLGSIYMKLGNKLKAAEFLEQAVNIYRRTEVKLGLMHTLSTMGALFENELEKALKFYSEALEIAEKTKSGDEAVILFNIGEAFRVSGNKEKAAIHYKKSLKAAERRRDENLRKMIVKTLNGIKKND
ncbi:tetratricopeptide repeat protein [candidate division WOR-3 bacterium]|nr:tetratricopeptide repeat protein [candidate division WOR-3 bacterium]